MPPAAGPGEPPPPLEGNDQLVASVITAAWAIALVVLLIVHGDIPPRERWWIWVTVTGLGMGLFGLVYVPHLKRSRARTAQRHAERDRN
jgi:drug/metabolite transporter (DMT)-like permease